MAPPSSFKAGVKCALWTAEEMFWSGVEGAKQEYLHQQYTYAQQAYHEWKQAQARRAAEDSSSPDSDRLISMLRQAECSLAERFPQIRLLLIDSGSFDHVAPVGWGPGKVQPPPSGPASLAQVATGAEVQQIGTKELCLRLQGGLLMKATFRVMPIVRPILSAGRLREHGWDVM